jgi:glucan biosynthesis protein C
VSTAPGAPKERILYLDAVRAFALFYGILSHGTTIAHPFIDQMPLFWLIQFASELFRNAAFFLVSGFFTSLVWSRSTPTAYLRNRAETLLLPLVVSMLTIVPVTNWLINVWHNGPIGFLDYLTGGWRRPSVGNDTWALHLWFLFALLAYAALTPLLFAIVRSQAFTRAIERYLDLTGRFAPLANVLLYAIAVTAVLAFHDQLVKPLTGGTKLAWLARATCYFLPIFAVGAIAFSHRRFLETLCTVNWLGILLFLGAYILIQQVGDGLPRPLERVLYWLSRAGLMLFVITALIGLARRFVNQPSPALTLAVDSAYSFYLFHVTFIYLVAFAARLFTDNLYLIFAAVVVVGLPLTLLFHVLVIDRIDLLRFLFTGRRRSKRAPAPASAA